MNKMKTLTLQGVTFEVVDEQARADIDVLKENSGSGSGASSWNDLKDKPFGETTVKGDTLTWDGNTEGLVSMDAFAEMIGTLYKISDAVPTLEDCISGATYTVAYYGEQRNFSVGYDEIAEMSGFAGCLCIGDFHAMVAPENNFQIEIEGVTAIFPEAGLYTLIGGDVILTSLTIPNYTGFETTTIRPIDTKYLPEALQFGETVVKSSTLTWDGNTEGLAVLDVGDGTLFYRVSDTPPALADFANGCHVECGNVINGFAYKDIEAHVQQSGMFYGESWVYLPQDASGAGMTVAKGLYFMNSAESGYVTSLTIPGYNGFETTTIKPLDEKYLPESVKGGGGGGAQPDWNANNGEPGHVLNRTHYAEKVVSTFVDEILRGLDEDTGAFHYKKPFSVYAGEEYTVSWDGIEYKCICIEVPMEETTLLMLGNVGAVLGGESTGEPFLIFADRSEQGKQGISEGDTARIAPLDGSTNPHVKITGLTDTIHELAPRYIATEISAIKNYIDTKNELVAERANVDISEGEYKKGTLSRFFCEHIERGDRVKLVVRIDGKDYYFLPQFYNVDGDNIYRANIIFNTTIVPNSVGHLYCLTVHINMYSNDDSSDVHYILEKLHAFPGH